MPAPESLKQRLGLVPLPSKQEEFDEPEVLEWPVLREEALSGIAGDFVELATRSSEADPAAVLVTFLVRASAELGPQPVLMVGDTKHYARLFAVIVGETSKSRKGTSAKPVERLFGDLASGKPEDDDDEILPFARTSPGPLSSGEGLIYAVRDKIKKAVVDKKTKKTSYVTVDEGAKDKRLFVCDQEFASALACMRREGNTLSTTLRCAWDDGNLDPLTKTSKISATGAHICILAHITRAELRKKFSETDAFNGLANRFLWVCAKRNGFIPFPEPMNDSELNRLMEKIYLVLLKSSLFKLNLKSKTVDLFSSIYPELSSAKDGLAGAVTSRAEAQVLRLSMIYALLDKCKSIDVHHLESALAVWDYCETSSKYIFHRFQIDPMNTKILKALEEHKQLEWMNLYAIFKNNCSKARIDEAVNELIQSGQAAVETIPTGRRPKRLLVKK